jgi:hypothetical protein
MSMALEAQHNVAQETSTLPPITEEQKSFNELALIFENNIKLSIQLTLLIRSFNKINCISCHGRLPELREELKKILSTPNEQPLPLIQNSPLGSSLPLSRDIRLNSIAIKALQQKRNLEALNVQIEGLSQERCLSCYEKKLRG